MNSYPKLMACAVDGTDPTVLALAGVLAVSLDCQGTQELPIPGLDDSQTRRLFARWFPGAETCIKLQWSATDAAGCAEPRIDEFDDLVSLLIDHADPNAGPPDEASCVAHAIAFASLGENHLWQDLHLPSRSELSAMIGRWFPRLAAKNTHDMKWKKFFYKQLCEREGLFICRAPSCGVCCDYSVCFGSE